MSDGKSSTPPQIRLRTFVQPPLKFWSDGSWPTPPQIWEWVGMGSPGPGRMLEFASSRLNLPFKFASDGPNRRMGWPGLGPALACNCLGTCWDDLPTSATEWLDLNLSCSNPPPNLCQTDRFGGLVGMGLLVPCPGPRLPWGALGLAAPECRRMLRLASSSLFFLDN